MRLGLSFAPLLMLVAAAPVAAASPRLVVARGAWASFDRGAACEAMAVALRPASGKEEQALVAVSFDRSGRRNGEFSARFRRPVRPGSSALLVIGDQPFQLVTRGSNAWSKGPRQEAAIIAMMRTANSMRIDARDQGGRRMTDRYSLDGAPTAIDAAAACSRKR